LSIRLAERVRGSEVRDCGLVKVFTDRIIMAVNILNQPLGATNFYMINVLIPLFIGFVKNLMKGGIFL